MLLMCPPCTKWSSHQRSNEKRKRKRVVRKQKKEASIHIDFCIELMKMQMDAGRYFIYEHPSSASSWQLPRMERLFKRQGIWSVVSDQCQYDQTGGGNLPLRKRTRYVANGQHLLHHLRKRCRGTRRGQCTNGLPHGSVCGQRAVKAAIYPQKLCLAISKGIIRQHTKHDDESDDSAARAELKRHAKSLLSIKRKGRVVNRDKDPREGAARQTAASNGPNYTPHQAINQFKQQ